MDNPVSDSAENLSVILDSMIMLGMTEHRYDITDSERMHMVAKIVGCNSPDDLFAAASSIQKYYIKHTSRDVMPLLDQLCSERLKRLIDAQGRS